LPRCRTRPLLSFAASSTSTAPASWSAASTACVAVSVLPGRAFIALTCDQVVRIFNTSDGMQVATQRHSHAPVLAVDMSPSGVNGISARCACSPPPRLVLHVKGRRFSGAFRLARDARVCNDCFSGDGSVKVWELQTMSLKGIFAAHPQNCNCARCRSPSRLFCDPPPPPPFPKICKHFTFLSRTFYPQLRPHRCVHRNRRRRRPRSRL
jgi:WD40 repeat protein